MISAYKIFKTQKLQNSIKITCYSVAFFTFCIIDAQELQQLINIALAHGSGGEDDYTQDAISNLQTVCNGFATLIYHIPTNTGYHKLEGHLNCVWEALEREPGLTNKLVRHFWAAQL